MERRSRLLVNPSETQAFPNPGSENRVIMGAAVPLEENVIGMFRSSGLRYVFVNPQELSMTSDLGLERYSLADIQGEDKLTRIRVYEKDRKTGSVTKTTVIFTEQHAPILLKPEHPPVA